MDTYRIRRYPQKSSQRICLTMDPSKAWSFVLCSISVADLFASAIWPNSFPICASSVLFLTGMYFINLLVEVALFLHQLHYWNRERFYIEEMLLFFVMLCYAFCGYSE